MRARFPRLPAALAPGPWLLAAAALIFVADGLRNGTLPSSPRHDLPAQFLPWLEFGFRELRSGNLPLWNPHSFGGTPFLGAFESALLYPPNWLHLLLPPAPAVNLTVALHLALAGILTHAWCRRRGVSAEAALVGGAAYMFSAPLLLQLQAGHMPVLAGLAWVPGIFLCLEAWAQSRTRGWLLAGMGCVALQVLAGNPQIAYYTALLAGLRAAAAAWTYRSTVPLRGTAAVYAGAALLAAAQIGAGIEAASESIRGGSVPAKYAASFFLPIENMLTLIVPWIFGDERRFAYFGRWYLWEASLFCGLSTLVAGLAALRGERRRWISPAFLLLATLALALGNQLPLYNLLRTTLPGWSALRGVAKFSGLACLFLAVLASEGVAALRDPRLAKRAALGTLAMGILAMGTAIWIGSAADAPGAGMLGGLQERMLAAAGAPIIPAVDGEAYWRHALSFATREIFDAGWALLALGGFLAAAARRPGLIRWLPAAVFLELGLFAWQARATCGLEEGYPPRWREVLRGDAGDYRVLHDWNVHPNAAMRMGLEDVMGYSQLPTRRWIELIAASNGYDPDQAVHLRPIRRLPGPLPMLRCRYVLEPGLLTQPRRLPPELPRALLVSEWESRPDREARLKALTDPKFDPRRKVILEAAPNPEPAAGPPGGTVRVAARGTDWLEIEVGLKKPAILLVTDAFAAGWRAVPLSGPQREMRVVPANHALRAVPLQAGDHRLRLEYAPIGFRIGRWVSLLALLAWTAGWLGWSLTSPAFGFKLSWRAPARFP